MQGIKDRLLLFLAAKEIRPATFERQMGISGGYLRNTTGNFGIDKLEKMHVVYPDLNIVWLLTGEGYMFVTEPENTIELQYGDRIQGSNIKNRVTDGSAAAIRAYEKLIAQQDEIIAQQNGTIEELNKTIADLRNERSNMQELINLLKLQTK